MPETSTSPIVWNIDPAHSSAEFKVKHMMISNVRGRFSKLSGTLVQDTADPSLSKVNASIDIDTLNTDDAQRDAHLKSADFFDSEQYPLMTFVSTKVEEKNDDAYVVTGELAMHGISKAVTLYVDGLSKPVTDPWGNTRIGLSATTKINRRGFGLSWNAALESGGILVGEDVQISLDLQFIKAAS